MDLQTLIQIFLSYVSLHFPLKQVVMIEPVFYNTNNLFPVANDLVYYVGNLYCNNKQAVRIKQGLVFGVDSNLLLLPNDSSTNPFATININVVINDATGFHTTNFIFSGFKITFNN